MLWAKFQKQHNDQSGLAALIVVTMLMLVTSLLVLGYSQVARRNQQQVTDRSLSTRAFYIAESGVNLAVEKMKATPNPYATASKTNCEPDAATGGAFTDNDYKVDDPNGARLSCLLIDSAPTTLEYSNIAKQTAQVVPLTPAAGSFSSINLSWQSTNPGGYGPCSPGPNSNPPDDGSSWNCGAPLMRIDMVRTGGAALSRAGLLSSQYTLFAYPTSGAGTSPINYTPGALGRTVTAHCASASTPLACNMRIDIAPLPVGSFTLRIVPLYDNMRLSVCANTGAGTCNVGLRGAQALVDSTGKSADIVKRIQVRVSMLQNSFIPNYGIQAASGLCKRYDIIPGSADPVFAEDADGSGAPAAASSPCSL